MTRQEIIDRVKVEMDELTPFDGGLIVSTPNALSKPIDAYINEILDECAEDVSLAAPLHKAFLKTYSGPVTVTSGVVTITKPADYLGMGYIKFPEWERQVTGVITETDPLYLRQKNAYTRAGVSKPVVAICNGKLECYSITSANGAGMEFKYRHRVPAEQLPDSLVPALAFLTTAKIFKIFEQAALIAPTMELYQNALNSK